LPGCERQNGALRRFNQAARGLTALRLVFILHNGNRVACPAGATSAMRGKLPHPAGRLTGFAWFFLDAHFFAKTRLNSLMAVLHAPIRMGGPHRTHIEGFNALKSTSPDRKYV
jgi:hypothetical protein